MTASYPGSVKTTFTTHVNVTEVIDASHPNSIQDEVVAIETAVGVSPSISTAPTSSTSWYNDGRDYGTLSSRVANIEAGHLNDTHSQYLRKSGDTGNVITPAATTTKGLVIKAASGQTANLQEWQNSSGTAVSYIDNNGNFNGPNASSTSAGYQDIMMLMGA